MKVGEIKMFATPVVFKATGRPSKNLTRILSPPIIHLELSGGKICPDRRGGYGNDSGLGEKGL